MFDEKQFVEKFTKMPEIYKTIELLKGDLELSKDICTLGSLEYLRYKSNTKKEESMEIYQSPDSKGVSIQRRSSEPYVYCEFRIQEDSESSIYFMTGDDPVYGYVFIVDDKIYYYGYESLYAASQKCIGLALSCYTKERFDENFISPDFVINIPQEIKDLGGKTFYAATFVQQMLSIANKKSKKNKR